jgi:transcriptional regulator
MYRPAHFREDDPAALRATIEAYPFATVVTHDASGLIASHLPLLFDPDAGAKGALLGHVARANGQRAALDGGEALVIFAGPHGYVSPSWYATQPSVPTWNYVAVHVYGRATLVGEDELARTLDALTITHERSLPEPWSTAGLAADYRKKLHAALAGFRIDIDRIEGKSKLSQNRSNEDRRGAIEGVRGPGDNAALADAMEQAMDRRAR